jgi:inhibitor of KinA sporulation pathway (predicted exonuclease)
LGYIIFDVEANARRYKTDIPQQIIQFGAVKLNEAMLEVDSYSQIIKPTHSPTLSHFSHMQTGITQEEIDHARSFEEVYLEFQDWCDLQHNLLICWGKEDIRFIKEDCILNGIEDNLPEGFIDILARFKHYAKSNNDYSVVKALEYLEIDQLGAAHSALDDARNTSNIFKKIFRFIDLKELDSYHKSPINSKTKRMLRFIVYDMYKKGIILEWDSFIEEVTAKHPQIVELINENNIEFYQDYLITVVEKMKQEKKTPHVSHNEESVTEL